MLIRRASPFTGIISEKEINVTEEQLLAWNTGMPIQHAMPNLSANDREFIKIGITPKEWDDMFEEDTEEEKK